MKAWTPSVRHEGVDGADDLMDDQMEDHVEDQIDDHTDPSYRQII